MCQETLQPSGGFSVCHVADAHLEVFAIGIHRPYHDPISKDEAQIDLVAGDPYLSVSSCYAGKHQDAIPAKNLHPVECHG